MSSSDKPNITEEEPLLGKVEPDGSVGIGDKDHGLGSENGGNQSPRHSPPLIGDEVDSGAEDIGDHQHRTRSGAGQQKMKAIPGTRKRQLKKTAEQFSLTPPSTESTRMERDALDAEEERDGLGGVPPNLREEQVYLHPTPSVPGPSAPTSRPSSRSASHLNDSPMSGESDLPPRRSSRPTPLAHNDATQPGNFELRDEGDSQSEIQSIMDQFDDDGGGPGEEEVMSPRLELAGPLFPDSVQHPPRMSSLEPVRSRSPTALPTIEAAKANTQSIYTDDLSQLQAGASSGQGNLKAPSLRSSKLQDSLHPETQNTPASPDGSLSYHRSSLPEPDPEPDLPFDFHRFLEQLRHRTADPVAKFLRSFLIEFGKKQWMVHEQVKIVSDFLAFIANKMAQCEVWRGVSDAEFDNAKEGMEKLVMNRLYSQTFSPAIRPSVPAPRNKTKSKQTEKLPGPGRRGQHQEDIERDEILAQKVRIYGWIQEEHLDIAPVGDSGRRFLALAQKGT